MQLSRAAEYSAAIEKSKEAAMITNMPDITVTSAHALLKPALEDLERAVPDARPGDKASLNARDWKETFIKTANYGWLRLPE